MPSAIRSPVMIERFVKQLVRDIDMVPYGEPQIVMFGSGNKKGYTLMQLIETSNICAHFVEETNDMYLDVFSCKDFNPRIVVNLVQGHFDPATIDGQFFLRTARFRDHRVQSIESNKPELK